MEASGPPKTRTVRLTDPAFRVAFAPSRRGGERPYRSLCSRLLSGAVLYAVLVCVASAEDPSCTTLLDRAADVVALRDADPVQGVEDGRQALDQVRSRASRCPVAEAMLLSGIGSNLHILGRLDEAVPTFQEALATLPADAAPEHGATVHRGLGVALADSGDYVLALDHYLDSLAASEAAGDTLGAAKTAGNIGNLYNTLNEFVLARDYHRQALTGFEEAGFKQGVAGTLLNLGAVSLKVAANAYEAGDPDEEQRVLNEAVGHLRQALVLFSELGNDRGVGHAESSIAQALANLGQVEEALPHYRRALALHQRIGDSRGEIHAEINLAEALTVLGQHDEAARYLDKVSQQRADLPAGLAILLARAQTSLAEARGRLDEALDWQRELLRLSSMLSDEQYNTRVLELQARFDTQKQAQEIELLRSQASLREVELSRQRLILGVAVVLVILIIVLAAVLYSRLRLGRRVASQLNRLAQTDHLTGLANRRYMMERIGHLVRDVRNGGPGFVLIMVDVDRFKLINDRHGHGVGDMALREVGRRLATRLRQQDLLARWGGEEFLVLLPGTDLAGGQVVAGNLCKAVAASPMQHGAVEIALTVSVGLCEYRAGMGVDECVNRADKAMYVAKHRGGDQVGSVDEVVADAGGRSSQ
jgi:diguanylate cyclase (GGDEF)-like protein